MKLRPRKKVTELQPQTHGVMAKPTSTKKRAAPGPNSNSKAQKTDLNQRKTTISYPPETLFLFRAFLNIATNGQYEERHLEIEYISNLFLVLLNRITQPCSLSKDQMPKILPLLSGAAKIYKTVNEEALRKNAIALFKAAFSNSNIINHITEVYTENNHNELILKCTGLLDLILELELFPCKKIPSKLVYRLSWFVCEKDSHLIQPYQAILAKMVINGYRPEFDDTTILMGAIIKGSRSKSESTADVAKKAFKLLEDDTPIFCAMVQNLKESNNFQQSVGTIFLNGFMIGPLSSNKKRLFLENLDIIKTHFKPKNENGQKAYKDLLAKIEAEDTDPLDQTEETQSCDG